MNARQMRLLSEPRMLTVSETSHVSFMYQWVMFDFIMPAALRAKHSVVVPWERYPWGTSPKSTCQYFERVKEFLRESEYRVSEKVNPEDVWPKYRCDHMIPEGSENSTLTIISWAN